MKATVNEIYGVLKQYFPIELEEDFDNSGFLVGRGESETDKVLVSLDITEQVIEEAAREGIKLIVSHHPLFFKNCINSVTSSTAAGKKILSLAENGISAICMHTNADSADGGVNDLLAGAAGLLCQVSSLGGGQSGKLGRIGVLPSPKSLNEYALYIKKALNANGVRTADGGKECFKIAVGGGACGDMIPLAAALGADTFVTADLKYHNFKQAMETGINLIDAGHFATENLICGRFKEILNNEFPQLEVKISQTNDDPTVFC